MKIVVTDCSWGSYDIEKKYLPQDAEVYCEQITDDEDRLIEACRGASATLSEYAPFTRRVLEALSPDLKMISNTAMGVDNIDLDAAKELGIAVANVPDYCFDEVSEHAVALMMAALRYIPGYDLSVKNDKKWDFGVAPKLYRINGMTMGMIGCGRIPRRVAKAMQAMGVKCVGYDPYLPAEIAKEASIEMTTLEDLAGRSDIILSHVPLMPSTAKMVAASVFDNIKECQVFVNTSRGGTVDYDLLAKALKDGRIRFAALDVVDHEPADFNSEIFTCDNVIFTPHAAFYSETALEEVRRRSAENVTNYLTGKEGRIDFVIKPE